MAQNVDLFLRSGQTINLEFEHFLVHRTGNDLRAIEFQPRKGAPQLVFADVSDVVAVGTRPSERGRGRRVTV
jgi:hypothetical protein